MSGSSAYRSVKRLNESSLKSRKPVRRVKVSLPKKLRGSRVNIGVRMGRRRVKEDLRGSLKVGAQAVKKAAKFVASKLKGPGSKIKSGLSKVKSFASRHAKSGFSKMKSLAGKLRQSKMAARLKNVGRRISAWRARRAYKKDLKAGKTKIII